MIGWLQAKIIAIILVIAFISAFIIVIRDDVQSRSRYEQANNNLIAIAKQQAINDKLIADVEKKQDEANQEQNKALVEMHNKGYLSDSHGDNPDWMCASSSGCH